MNKKISLSATIPEELDNSRLDQALAKLFPDYSRAKLQAWVKDGFVFVDKTLLRSKDRVFTNQLIEINAEIIENNTWQAEALELDIIFEDDDLLVINKPVGLVVHPGAGTPHGTMLNALLHHCPALVAIPRAGIIHRLDKDTSGLLVITKTPRAHTKLVADLQERLIKREYIAIVNGTMTSGGTVDAPIARHPKNRLKMAVVTTGKPAITHYRIIQRFRDFTQIKVMLETGRTHQIRVHMAHIGYPIIGDQTYNPRLKIPKKCSEKLRSCLQNFKRQVLHARKLCFNHPATNEPLEFKAPLPADIQELLNILHSDNHITTP